ncbi:MAG: LCP family protein [Bacillota bacterium]|nr:LCP family protein [Bacillota bacterium]
MVDINRNSPTRKDNRSNKKKRRRRILLAIILTFLVAGLGYAGYVGYHAYQAVNKSYQQIKGRGDKSALRKSPVYVSSDPFSVLILGIENYASGKKGDPGRTDTMMVATFNPKEQTMKLVSIPRDSRVRIPGWRKDKINAAYGHGGKELSIKTVENLLDIPIDYYVTVNFDGFKNIVNILGGVDVNVPFNFNDIDPQWHRYYFYKGPQHLSGNAALVYARMRYKDPRGDFGRNTRQREIVSAVIGKLSSPSAILKIGDIADQLGNNIETNMKISDAIAFRQKYTDFNSSKIQQLQIKGSDLYLGYPKEYFFQPDPQSLDEVSTILKTHLGLISPSSSSGSTTSSGSSSSDSQSSSNDSQNSSNH